MASNSLGDRWVGHPLLAAFTGQRPLSAYVRFSLWDEQASKFQNLPQGIDVSLVDNSPLFSTTTVDTVQTDANGVAHFSIANLSPQFPDLFFLVDTSALPSGFAHHAAFPAEWSTKGWRSSDGKTPGYHEKFAGTTFGSSTDPIEFEIGVVLFITIQVENTTDPGSFIFLLPETPVSLHAGGIFQSTVDLSTKSDDHGIAHFFSFDIEPGSNIDITIYATNNAGSNKFPFLQGVYVDDWPGIPSTTWSYFISSTLANLTNLDKTSTGSATAGWVVKLTAQVSAHTCAAFTFLQNLTELNCLLHYSVPGWQDYLGGRINMRALLAGGLSLPSTSLPEAGSINLPKDFDDWREGQFHEFAHQILWILGNLSLADIAYSYCLGSGVMSHSWHARYNTHHALLEGWAEAFAYIFNLEYFTVTKQSGKFFLKFKRNYVYKGTLISLPTSSYVTDSNEIEFASGVLDQERNWGESVEGMFAAGLLYVFRKHVMKNFSSGSPAIPPAPGGDIRTHPSLAWLTSTAPSGIQTRERFRRTFVAPALAMANRPSPTTTAFIDAMRVANMPPDGSVSDWNEIRDILQDFYLAKPEIVIISPAQIGASGGTTVQIQGYHFATGASTEIFFGVNKATITSLSNGIITCIAPAGSAGTTVDLKLTSDDGSDLKPNAITYS
jgi:hypothetical protein